MKIRNLFFATLCFTAASLFASEPEFTLYGFEIQNHPNNVVGAGETIFISLMVKNDSTVDSKGGTVRLITPNGHASLTTNRFASVPPLKAGESYEVPMGLLTADILPIAAPDETISFPIEWKTWEGRSGSKTFDARVQVPVIQIVSAALAQEVTPGGTGKLFVSISNSGNGPASSIEILPATSSCLTEARGKLYLDRLEAGQTVQLSMPLDLQLDQTCGDGQVGHVDLRGSFDAKATSIFFEGRAWFGVGAPKDITERYENLNVRIPDASQPVHVPLAFAHAGLVLDLGVFLDIKHDFAGDLSVQIAPPGTDKGTMIYNRSAGSKKDIRETFGYGGQANPSLKKLAGTSTEGQWTLILQDHDSPDEGTLHSVGLTIHGYFR